MSSQVVPDISTYTAVELANLPTALPEFVRADGTPTMSRNEAESIIRRFPSMFPEVHAAYAAAARGERLAAPPMLTGLEARYPTMVPKR